jgi:hypothetical protein
MKDKFNPDIPITFYTSGLLIINLLEVSTLQNNLHDDGCHQIVEVSIIFFIFRVMVHNLFYLLS